ncbi:MAG: bifunctional serine/threonine-protein kinase/formylglycine-generating enzyme family protein [Pseudomonadota bacterium]
MDIPGYTIRGQLGAGGMAVVYLAEQEVLRREVAIKVLHRPGGEDQDVTRRFLHEAQTIARLQHPNIVAIFDFGKTPAGDLYYCMPCLPKGDLSTYRYSGDASLKPLLAQICAGLEYAHRHDVVHRDIKPENILFDAQGNAQIADFGIAFSTQVTDPRITKEGQTLGSSYYMSPEQSRGEAVDARSDVYSVGVVLFELLAGRPPFDGKDDLAILVAQLSEPVPSLPEHVRHWQPVVERALAKSPDDRFASVQSFLQAIRAVEPGTKPTHWYAQPRLWGAGAAGLLAALVLGALVGRPDPDLVGNDEPAVAEAGTNPEPLRQAESASEGGAPPLAADVGKGEGLREAKTDAAATAPKAGELLSDVGGPATAFVPPTVEDEQGKVSSLDKPFAMATTEVTVAQFREFSEATDREPSACRRAGSPVAAFGRVSWRDPGFAQQDDHPVVCVSFLDATAFARWLSEKSGYDYALPSEAQWRHAAWVGHDADIACQTGNVAGREQRPGVFSGRRFRCHDGYQQTAPVASFSANRLNLFDLRGNASEWTSDCRPEPGRVGKVLSTLKLSKASGCQHRTVRGTSWRDGLTKAMRYNVAYLDETKGLTTVGFRLVRAIPD